MSNRVLFPGPLALALATLVTALHASVAHGAWAPNGSPVCTVVNLQEGSASASDWSDGAIISWYDARNSTSGDLFAQRISAAGSPLWTAGGVPVCTALNTQNLPTVLPDFAHGAVVFWQDWRSSTLGPDIYAQRIDSNGNALWTFNGIALGTTSLEEGYGGISAITDGTSGIVNPPAYLVAWLERDSSERRDTVRIQRVDVNGAGLWTTAGAGGVQVCAYFSEKENLAMATDGVGSPLNPKGAVLTWNEERVPAQGQDIVARRVSSSGIPQWLGNGVVVCDLPGTQRAPVITNVGGGSVIIAWQDRRNGTDDIYAQKLDSSGNALWLAEGLPVCRALNIQTNPAIQSDGAGGVFVAWPDARDGSYRLYAQRLDGNGSPLWPVDGVLICPNSSGISEVEMIGDAAGGFIVSWHDRRTPDFGNIYAERVDANGNILWDPAGEPLCVATGTQQRGRLVPISNSGAIVSWDDDRTGVSDVYANMVSGSGGVSDAPLAGVAAPLLSLASQNPARGVARFQLQLPSTRAVAMDVMDVAGRRVRSLAHQSFAAGAHSLTWDGTDDAGVAVGSGVYFVRLTAGEARESSRVVMLR